MPVTITILSATTARWFFKQTVNDLELLKKRQVMVADRQAVEISEIENLTSIATIVVFIVSIVFTIGLGFALIRYTDNAFTQLKQGTIIIGGGNLDYRIPLKTNDELGQAAAAFNTMSAKLQHAISEVERARRKCRSSEPGEE